MAAWAWFALALPYLPEPFAPAHGCRRLALSRLCRKERFAGARRSVGNSDYRQRQQTGSIIDRWPPSEESPEIRKFAALISGFWSIRLLGNSNLRQFPVISIWYTDCFIPKCSSVSALGFAASSACTQDVWNSTGQEIAPKQAPHPSRPTFERRSFGRPVTGRCELWAVSRGGETARRL